MKRFLAYMLVCCIILANFASLAYADGYEIMPYNDSPPTVVTSD